MPRSLEVTDTTVVLRPAPSTVWLWMFVFATALNWMFWKFSLYEVSARSLWFLVLPSLALVAAAVEFINARISVTTIDGARDLVLIERLPRFGLSAKQRRYALSDFAAVESHSEVGGKSVACRVSLVTTRLQSLVVLNGSGGYGAKSFWHTPMPAETEEAVAVRVAIARVTGLKDMGYRGTLGMSVVSYESIDG